MVNRFGATLPKQQIEQAMKEYQAFEKDLKQTGVHPRDLLASLVDPSSSFSIRPPAR
jgi:uncharacterized membrane protein